MAKANKNKVSDEVVATAEALTKANQRPGQTKEQNKLISAGIQKGIEQYKKQHKAKMREADKQRKKQSSKNAEQCAGADHLAEAKDNTKPSILPWVLLGLSWLGFAAYVYSYSPS
ncbi:DUF2956 domain-containing protein [Agarivorans sp. DSG3-1]|uniref:DUF2956 domain-containing protein n=1 Tax=Agarivorans sp. DSG3-1 TaxID=3342249 RepID=UPI00398E3231